MSKTFNFDNLPDSLTGSDKTQNIVSIEKLTPTKAIVYYREFNSDRDISKSVLKSKKIEWNMWFLVHDEKMANVLSNTMFEGKTVFHVEKMKGDKFYQYYCQVTHENIFFNIVKDLIKDAYNIAFNRDVESYWEMNKDVDIAEKEVYMLPENEQIMIQTGMTHFKSMTPLEPKIMAVDLETTNIDPEIANIYLISIDTNYGYKKLIYKDDDDEYEILSEFIEIIKTEDPDIIIGHNLFNYDLQVLKNRIEKNGMKFDIGRPRYSRFENVYFPPNPHNLKVGESTERFPNAYVNGRHIVDTLHLAKKLDAIKRNMLNKKLKYLAADYFKIYPEGQDSGRTYIEGSEIYNTWLVDREKVLKYAYEDTFETIEIYKRMVSAYFSMSQMIPTSFQKLCHCGNSAIWTTLLLREYIKERYDYNDHECYRYSVPAPMDKEKFEGGFTACEAQGMLENVHKLDVACVDRETEILTKRGWLEAWQIESDDFIMTYDIVVNKFQYHSIKMWNKYNYDGDMIHIEGNGLDQFLTPNHRCLYYDSLDNNYKYKDADSVNLTTKFPILDNNPYLHEDRIYKTVPNKIEKKYYQGMVYCPTITNENFIIRRNGKVSITGNSLYPNIMIMNNIKPFHDHLDMFPSMLKGMTDFRLDAKKRAGELKSNGQDNTQEYMILEGLSGAIKIVINSSFGLLGSGIALFNNPKGAAEITRQGRHIIKGVRDRLISDGGLPIETDSVTKDCPVFIKYKHNNLMDIVPIYRLFDMGIESHDPKRRYEGYDDIEVLSKNGWCDIKYVKRNECNKKVYEIESENGYTQVTEDHSLFRDGEEITVKDVNVGEKSFDTVSFDSDIDDIIQEIKDLECSDWEYGFKTKKRKFKTVHNNGSIFKINNPTITKIKEIDYDDYVYDVSTEDGTFIGGIGYVIHHNTDGIIFLPPESKKDNVSEYVQEISDTLPDLINLDHEAEMDKFFSYKTKNYIYREKKVDEDGSISYTYKIKGAALKSSSKSPIITNSFKLIRNYMFDNEFLKVKEEYIKNITAIECREIPTRDICKSTRLRDSITNYQTDLKVYRELNNRNKARKPWMELLIDKEEKTGKFHGYSSGDQVNYYMTGEKANNSYVIKTKEPITHECDVCLGKGCKRCDNLGYVYEYMLCTKCYGRGYNTKNSPIVIKDLKWTKRTRKMKDFMDLMNIFDLYIEDKILDVKDLINKIENVDEDNPIEFYEKGLYILLDNLKLLNTVSIDFSNLQIEIKDKHTNELIDLNQVTEDNSDQFVMKATFDGVKEVTCRTCYKTISQKDLLPEQKGEKILLPGYKPGYVFKTEDIYTLNSKLLEDADDEIEVIEKELLDKEGNVVIDEYGNPMTYTETINKRDYNIEFYKKDYWNSVVKPWAVCLSEEDFNLIFSKQDIPEDKEIKTIFTIIPLKEEQLIEKDEEKDEEDEEKTDPNELEIDLVKLKRK